MSTLIYVEPLNNKIYFNVYAGISDGHDPSEASTCALRGRVMEARAVAAGELRRLGHTRRRDTHRA